MVPYIYLGVRYYSSREDAGLTRKAGQPKRVPGDDIVELIQQVELEVIPEPTLVSR